MRKAAVISVLFLLMQLCMANFVEGVDVGYIPAQGNPQETGELLPNPDLLVEPDVEIGDSSPEFGYDYELQGDRGSVNLTWTHNSYHHPSYEYVPYVGYPQCSEFARMKQEFTWEYNQTPVTLSVSASVQITCTGDFATEENGDDMYAMGFWIGVPGYSYAGRIKMIDDLKAGQNYDIQFLMTSFEAEQYFAGSVSQGGLQMYPHDTYTMFVGLIPTEQFAGFFGGLEVWEVYDGSVTAAISHYSVKALLDVEDLTPPLIAPKFNTSSLWNESTFGLGLEPMGQNELVYITGYGYSGSFTLGKLTSEHSSIWNVAPSASGVGLSGNPICDVTGNNVFLLSTNYTPSSVGLLLIKLDSEGQELWNVSVDLYGYDIPVLIDVSSSGAIYLVSLSFVYGDMMIIEDTELIYSLIRLDSQGNRLWNKTLLNQSFMNYVFTVYNSQLSMGISCSGDTVYVGMPYSLLKYDSSGNELWNVTHDYFGFCSDPYGGFYTSERLLNDEYQISKWGTEGSIRWSRSLSLDYGLGWRDFPVVGRMEVGPDQLLYVDLEYRCVNHVMMISRLTRSGQIHSQDTLFDLEDVESFGPSYIKPFISSIAVTGDGLVHLAIMNESIASDPYNIPYYSTPANVLLAYELSGPFIFTMGPESLIITGVATLILGGIAWDHFIRGRTRLEEILPEQEEIDPWKILMETADED